MGRKTLDELIAMKKQVIERTLNRELTRTQAAGLLNMHPNAFSRLKSRYREEGVSALMPEKPGPKPGKTVKNRTPEWIEEIVVLIARSRPDLGPLPLSELIFDVQGIRIHQSTIWRILGRRKIRYSTEYKRWQSEKPVQLYCLDTPGLELQLDGSYPFGRSRKLVCFDAIDDCSRWVYGRLYDRETAANAIDFIKHLIRVAPFRIQRIRVDNRYGKDLKAFCDTVGIELIVNDPYEPKQNGKIERFHKTSKREFFWKYCSFHDSQELIQLKLNQWLAHYNTKRRHGGYGMNRMTPSQKIASTLFLSLNNLNYPQNVTLTVQQYNF
jgi:transposase InsO family protein